MAGFLVKVLFLVYRWTSCFLFIWQRAERGSEFSHISSHKGTNPFHKGSPLLALPPDTFTLKIRISTYEFGDGRSTNFQSMTPFRGREQKGARVPISCEHSLCLGQECCVPTKCRALVNLVG